MPFRSLALTALLLSALACQDTTKHEPLPVAQAPSATAITIAVESEPAGASVTIDGKSVGNTPLSQALEPGEHRIGLSKDGFVPHESTVTVGAGSPTGFRVPLVRKP